MFSIKNRKKIMWFILFLISLFLLYIIIPYKIVLSPQLSQLVFIYDDEDFVDIKEQVSYTLGGVVGYTAKVEENSGNTVLFVNKFILFNWLKKCQKYCFNIDTKGIEVSDTDVTVKCLKEDVPRKIIDIDEFVRCYVVKQLLHGVKTESINIKVNFIEQSSGDLLLSAEWPKQEYNIDRERFFMEIK